MSRYLIKVTHLEGRLKGKSYLLKKGGGIVGNRKFYFYSDTYNDERTVKSVCTKMRKNNELNNRCSYEPYELPDDM